MPNIFPSSSSCKSIFILFLAIVILNTFSNVFIHWRISKNQNDKNDTFQLNSIVHSNSNNNQTWLVEIWSKSAIGQYLWENILQGRTEAKILPNDLYLEGWKTIDHVSFKFRTGPSLKPESLPLFSVKNLILVLNWRSSDKIQYAKRWLDELVRNETESIKNIGIIALGNERCNNNWFLRDYFQNDTRFRFLFIVYDWKMIDNRRIFQWPLGIATYRNFPLPNVHQEYYSLIQNVRPFLCNFIATVYSNSSRQELLNLFNDESMLEFKQECFFKTRPKWTPNESDQSMETYVQALKRSVLTLSPVGMNHECYRILEAVEYASIPVIEENQEFLLKTKNNHCDKQNILRLFKQTQAPFIYISNWTQQLPDILRNYQKKTETERIQQRIHLMKWYHRFKLYFKNHLINVIQRKFL